MLRKLRMSQELFSQLQTHLLKDAPDENAAFVLIGQSKLDDEFRYLARRIVEIPQNSFRVKNSYHLDVSPEVIHGIVRLCEANELGLAICHSHPFEQGIPKYSSSDDHGESRIGEFFWQCLPDMPLISLLVGQNEIVGRVWNNTGEISASKLDSVTLVGSSIREIPIQTPSFDHNNFDGIYDRQELALGKAGQQKINKTRVGIVGVGGTGSAVAEQLVRLGVKDFVLIDKDHITPSNITRVYGASKFHRWHKFWLMLTRQYHKVDIMERHLKKIGKNVSVQKSRYNVVTKGTAELLLDRDVIFSCTDEHWGRSIINQIAYQYLIPVINIGMHIDSDEGEIQSGTVGTHLLHPDNPCLWCYEFLDAERITAESLPKDQRQQLHREDYIQDIDTNEPSVISFTTLGASIATNMFLQLITNYLGRYGSFKSLRFDVLQNDLRRGTVEKKEKCDCQYRLGKGDFIPLDLVSKEVIPEQ